MNNGYQKSNGCGADKEGGKFFKTFFYSNAQSKHFRPLAYNVRPLADVRDLNTALVNVVMSPAYWQAVVGRS